MTQSVYQMQET